MGSKPTLYQSFWRRPESRKGIWLFASMGFNLLAPNLGLSMRRFQGRIPRKDTYLNSGEVMVEACRIPYARLSGGVARGGRLYFIPPVELPLLRGRLGGEDGGGFDGE